MSKQVCYDAMRFSRGGGFVSRDMIPHGVRSPVRTVYRTIDSDITNGELVFWTTCGPATTFDPKITGCAGTWFFDDGTTLAATSGVEISKTFAAEGLHRAVYRPASGGLAAITAIDASADLLVAVHGLQKTLLTTVSLNTNPGLVLRLSDLPNIAITAYQTMSLLPLLSGTTAELSRIATYAHFALGGITGQVSDLPATLQQGYFYSTSLVAGSIAHLTVIRDIRIYSMGWLTADVDTVIDSMWTARAAYTYATPAIQIGGTNQAPTGTIGAPVEGADWHQDGATWIPRTAGAKIYDLAKDVNSEGFKKWTITYTGGSIAP